MQSRRAMREQAFLLLFEQSFGDDGINDIFERAKESRDMPDDTRSLELASEAHEHISEIDPVIEKNLVDRKMQRLSPVVLAVLRLALYEIIYAEKIDTSVAINEAVEIAKKFSTDEEAKFINGVLGTYARTIDN